VPDEPEFTTRPGKDDLNPGSIPMSERNSFPPRETWGRMTFQ
jgi:hypothetical protein